MSWMKYLVEFLSNTPESYWKCTYVVGSIDDVKPNEIIEQLAKVYNQDDIWIFRGVPARPIIKRLKQYKQPKLLLFDCLTKHNKKRHRINYDVLLNLEQGVDDRLGPNPSGMLYFESPNHVLVFTHKAPKDKIVEDGHTHIVYTDGRVQKFHQRGIVDEEGTVQWEHNIVSQGTPENSHNPEASETSEDTFIEW